LTEVVDFLTPVSEFWKRISNKLRSLSLAFPAISERCNVRAADTVVKETINK